MKKLTLALALILETHCLCAQSFLKGNKIIESGIGLTYMNYESYNPSIDERKDNIAVSWIVPVSFEYAIDKRIGLGAEIDFVTYFTERDTITNAIADARSTDFYAKFNFHWLRKTKVDLFSGLAIGISGFKYHDNSYNEGKYKATGPGYKLVLIASRFYLPKHLFIGFAFNTSGYSYKNGTISNKYNDEIEYQLKGNGYQLNFSLGYKW